jgi:hypothetical protein
MKKKLSIEDYHTLAQVSLLDAISQFAEKNKKFDESAIKVTAPGSKRVFWGSFIKHPSPKSLRAVHFRIGMVKRLIVRDSGNQYVVKLDRPSPNFKLDGSQKVYDRRGTGIGKISTILEDAGSVIVVALDPGKIPVVKIGDIIFLRYRVNFQSNLH